MNKYYIIISLMLLVFCAGCNKNDVTVISKNPCIVEIKDTYTTIYKKPQYESTINKDGYLAEDTNKDKNYNAEVCYNDEYNMAISIKIISKTDINDKNYNVDKSIHEFNVTKIEFTDIPDSKFKKPKGLILPDILFKKLM